MTTTAARTTTDCPSWCVEHISPDHEDNGVRWGGTTTLHMGATAKGESVEGGWLASVSVDGPAPIAVDVFHNGQMTPAQARSFASAINAACDVAEGDRASARVARRVASIITGEPLYPDRIEALAAALGVDWLELVLTNPEAATAAP